MAEGNKYRMLKHTSDVGVRVEGQSANELFANAAYALFDVMADLNRVEVRESLRLEVDGADRNDLMVSWLTEVLYLFQSTGYLLREFDILDASETRVAATARGEKFDPDRHDILREIKGILASKCRTEKIGNKWTAQVVFEI